MEFPNSDTKNQPATEPGLKSIYKNIFSAICIVAASVIAQYGYGQSKTANDRVPEYNKFLFGTNLGWYPPWDDYHVADVALGNPDYRVEGMGATSLRPVLYEHFLEKWGYDARLKVYKHYNRLGARDLTMFIGNPSKKHMDMASYGKDGKQSKMFANMYEPIWDGGKNGTPVNEENYMALYLYKLVKKYGQYVKFWEVWNEPDFDYTGNAWKKRGEAGNWFEQDPDPSQLHNLKAPVEHYVRALRISYEVIKSLEPDDFICIGGIGYVSFLDAVLRKTDNPKGGTSTDAYPLKGGAYFDCLSYHSYPQYFLSKWTPVGRKYFRHSDAAKDVFITLKNSMEGVLSDYGYNGATFPKKQVIVTETNIPRKQKGDHIGSERAQLNYLMKAYIRGQIENIRAIYVYALSDGVQKEGTKYHPFVHMGLSKTFIGREPRDYEPNSLGIAFRTMSMLLDGWTYDSEETKRLKLDSKKTDGGAFRSEKGEFMYVLWAKTSTDLVEDASYTYHFPSLMDIDSLYVRRWNYSSTRKTVWINSENIVLSSSPSFFTVKSKGKTTYFPNPVEDWLNIPNKEAGQLVEMLTMDGRKVLEKITEKPKDVVNCSRLASGTYIVRLDGVNVRRVQKK